MKNTADISTDGINVYATMRVKPRKIALVILSAVFLITTTLFIFIVYALETNDVKGSILPFLITFVLFVLLPGRYLVWNLFGKETLIINTKSISYSLDYGFIMTNLKTITYDKLGTGFRETREMNNKLYGNLMFYNYNKDNNLPELIHQTTVLIEMEHLKLIDLLIEAIFENEFNEMHGFVGYSLN